MLEFDIFASDFREKATNTFYMHRRTITDKDTLASAVSHDYVGAEYFGGLRSNSNFMSSNCLIMDVDNDHSDNPEDWKTPEEIKQSFTDVCFAVHYSRHHMQQKDGKSPRPKFHVLFPIDETTSDSKYSNMKREVYKIFPYFDKNALDAARFFYGTQNPQVELVDGERNLTAFMAEHETLNPQTPPQLPEVPATTAASAISESSQLNTQDSQSDIIPEGMRNNTLLSYAEKILKRDGDTSMTYKNFIAMSAKCRPPLDENEVQLIWDNAFDFYKREIASDDDYISPEKFNAQDDPKERFTLEPEDYSDLGQSNVFIRENRDILLYSEATGFLVFNGGYWEDNNAKIKKLVQDFTERQYKEAVDEIENAQTALQKSGALNTVMQYSPKRAKGLMTTPAQRAALQQYEHASEYGKFVLTRRKNSNIDAVVNSIMPQLLFDVDKLNADPFLLNTPSGTVDLRTSELKPHNPKDLITKQTAVSCGEQNMQLWLDALDTFFCGDSDLINYVQEIVGLAAIGEVFEEAMIIAYGSGRNGKSTFWNTVARVLGNDSYSGKLSAAALTLGYRHSVKAELAELFGKRIIIASELEENMSLNTSVVKNLCSTDRIQAEKKFKEPFDFKPSHTLVLYTNHLPNVGTTDDGTWRRIILVPFNATIEKNQDIKNYSNYLFEKAGGAILSWIVEGARRIIEKKYKLDTPQIVIDALKSYRADNDWFAKFLDECCEIDPSYSEQSSRLYDAYREHCAIENERARRHKDFYKALDDAGFRRAKQGNKYMVVHGLRVCVFPSSEE